VRSRRQSAGVSVGFPAFSFLTLSIYGEGGELARRVGTPFLLFFGYHPIMGGYYINVSLKTDDPARVHEAIIQTFAAEGFPLLGDKPAPAAVEDEDELPDGDAWYGVLVSGASGRGWVTVYVDDWQDSGLFAKRLSQSLAAPALEVWVADDVHWGYTYYEGGEVRDRYADAPSEVAETEEEAALYVGQAEALAPILQVPPAQFARLLQEAHAQAGQFTGGPLDTLAQAVGLPFEHVFTGYDYFFSDNPDDYAEDLENWAGFRHLAFGLPKGRETLAE